MRARTRLVIVAALAAVTFGLNAPPAQAHMLKCDPWGKLTAAKHRCHQHQARHAHYALRFASRAYRKPQFRKHGHVLRVIVRDHRWLRRTMHRKIRAYRTLRAVSARPPNYHAWLCIHSHEGAWNDTGDPYWGGLQMDWSFMRTYGEHLLRTKGPASNWTPLEQMWVAERAYQSGRGFYPWPNTARMCGLL